MTHRRAFTLLELLVVIAIIAILVGILAPSLEKANERARNTVCAQNLHQLAVGFNTYANDSNGLIPAGPATPNPLFAPRLWDSVGNHQLWISATKQFNGLGVLYGGGWINDPRCFVCPSDDDKSLKPNIKTMLGGSQDVYGSYAYRQFDQRSMRKLNDPGLNGAGNPAKALILDWQSEGPAPFAHDSHDSGEYVNVLYNDGRIETFAGGDHPLGAEATDYKALPASYLKRLDQDWVTADWAAEHGISGAPQLP